MIAKLVRFWSLRQQAVTKGHGYEESGSPGKTGVEMSCGRVPNQGDSRLCTPMLGNGRVGEMLELLVGASVGLEAE